MIESVASVVSAASDLEAPDGLLTQWLGCFHENHTVEKPYTIPPITDGHGTVASTRPHSIALAANFEDAPEDAIAPMGAMAHVGVLDPLILMPTTDIMIRWAATTFLATPGLVGTVPMAMDGFVRWCEEPGAPKLHTCNHCDGTLLEPGEKPLDPGVRLVCQHCDGSGLEGDISDGFAKIGPVTVDRRMLRRVYRHLAVGGGEVAFAWAPSTGRLGAYDAHLRAFSTGVKGEMKWGGWKIMLADLRAGETKRAVVVA